MRWAPVMVAASATAAAYYQLRPIYTAKVDYHRAFNDHDLAAIRDMSGGHITAEQNPGVRLWPHFLNEDATKPLLDALQELKRAYGINLIEPAHAAIYRWQMSYLKQPPPVNMLRITGRPEHEQQQRPPWGYGDAFDESKLPQEIRQLVAAVRALPGVRLGPLRDVTINHRRHGFLRLDPHLDPAGDGENVFILGLDSDTVLTLCPARLWRAAHAWRRLTGGVGGEELRVVQLEAERGWTGWDLDVLLRQGDLVLLSGPARWQWTHGTRLGVEEAGRPGLHDWWGVRERVVGRGRERHSIVLAFAAPDGVVAGAGREKRYGSGYYGYRLDVSK